MEELKKHKLKSERLNLIFGGATRRVVGSDTSLDGQTFVDVSVEDHDGNIISVDCHQSDADWGNPGVGDEVG